MLNNDPAYVRISEEELYQEYLKAIPSLNISSENRQQKIIEDQKEKLGEIEQLTSMVNQLAQKMKLLDNLDFDTDFSKIIDENFEFKAMIKQLDNKDVAEIVSELE